MNHPSRGAALVTVLFALLLLETLIALALAAVLAAARTAHWAVASTRARAAAEAGAASVDTMMTPSWLDTASVPIELTSRHLLGGGSYRVSHRRLSRRIALLEAEGRSRGTYALATIGRLAARRPASPPLSAAFTYGGTLDLAGGGSVDARGSPTADWEWAPCEAPTAAASSMSLAPAVALLLFDSLPHQRWRPFAKTAWGPGTTVVPGPVLTSGGWCEENAWANWGDPTDRAARCGAYGPVVYHDGDLRVAGGWGQGLLVVTGDLALGGGFLFHGLIAVGGRLMVEESGASVTGALVAAGRGDEPHQIRGALRVQYSKCLMELWLPSWGRPEALAPYGRVQSFEVP